MKSHEVILVGMDLTPLSGAAFSAALDVARDAGSEAVHLMHVVPSVGPWATSPDYAITDALLRVVQNLSRDAERQLEEYQIPQGLDARIVRKVVHGAPARELTAYAEEAVADMIVVASRELSGLRRFVLGSVAHTLVRSAKVPVLIVSERRPWRSPRKIVAAVDLSPVSERVLDRALALARHGGQTKVQVLSRFEPAQTLSEPGGLLPHHLSAAERQALSAAHLAKVEALVGRIERRDIEVVIDIATEGTASDAILASLARDPAELLVVGASGHNAWQRLFLGSTANRVVSEAPCPVLVVPA